MVDDDAIDDPHQHAHARTPGEGRFPGSFVAADLSDPAATRAALDDALSRFEIDGPVNNLGLTVLAPLGSIDLGDLGRVIDVNLRLAVQRAQAVLPGMKARRRGRIVNVPSRAIRKSFLSDVASFVTGQTLYTCCGLSVGRAAL